MNKRYKVTLTTIGPVHIGSGETFTTKEYIILEDYTLLVPNIGLLFQLLNHEQRQKLENFYGGSKTNSNNKKQRLGEFLKDELGICKIPEQLIRTGVIIDITDNLKNPRNCSKEKDSSKNKEPISNYKNSINEKCDDKNHGSYYNLVPKAKCIKCTPNDSQLLNNNFKDGITIAEDQMNFNDVHLFVTDTLTKQPYIPGSSIKGTIVNILNKRNDELDIDISKSLSFSDSKLIDKDSFYITSKWDKLSNEGFKRVKTRQAKNPHELQALKRVCLKPGTGVEFDLTIYDNDKIDIERLKEEILKVFDNYCDYCKKFIDVDRANNDLNIYVGGGVGFLNKTKYFSNEKQNEILDELNKQFSIDPEAVKRRDHKNMGPLTREQEQCSCNKCKHKHSCGIGCGKQCRTRFTKSRLINDIDEFGAVPRNLKLGKYKESKLEMGKCKIEFEEIKND